jgi:hypothetical protein
MLVSKECWERGCSCYDDRVDKDPVEVVRRGWVGLTDEEVDEFYWISASTLEAIEAKLKEKNHG